jgi:hypothetical protein
LEKEKEIMYYLIQENLFKETHFHVLIDLLNRHKLEYKIVRFVPFLGVMYEEHEDVEVTMDRKDVFLFGSTNMTKAGDKYGFDPGVIYNPDTHDMRVYMAKYGSHMLNYDGYICDFEEMDKENQIPFFFARPTKDLKIFSGQCYGLEVWNKYVRDTIASGTYDSIRERTEVLIAPPKTIQKEIRCWIVDGKVVTISQYKIGAKVIQQNYDHEQEAIDYAQKIADIFCPSRAFVLDICLYNGEYKVVEINCINCAGFYEANMSKLIQALEEAFNPARVTYNKDPFIMEKKEKKYLFLDDVRMPYEVGDYISPVELKAMYRKENWQIVRSYDEFVAWILNNGLPDVVSFDHDIADAHYNPDTWTESFKYQEKTGYDCAKWLTEFCMHECWDLPEYHVHSMNPVGAENIKRHLRGYVKCDPLGDIDVPHGVYFWPRKWSKEKVRRVKELAMLLRHGNKTVRMLKRLKKRANEILHVE